MQFWVMPKDLVKFVNTSTLIQLRKFYLYQFWHDARTTCKYHYHWSWIFQRAVWISIW